MHSYLYLNIILFTLTTYFTKSNGNYADNLLDIMPTKRITRGISEKAVLDYLEKYVGTIDIGSFAGDYYLVQFLDYINRIITFRHIDQWKQLYDIYTTDLDLNTTINKTIFVFVLEKTEDRMKTSREKKTFVVLRRVQDESPMFYISYIYLKEPHDPPLSTVREIGGEKYELEWDLWNHRGGKEYRSQRFGYTHCKASIFVPCRADEARNFPATTTIIEKQSKIPKTKVLNFAVGKISLPNTGDDVDADADIDFFEDLDDDVTDARYIGEKLENLTKSELNKKQGRIKSALPKNSNGAPKGLLGSFINLGVNVIKTFVKFGTGLVKSFGGKYGGLGTKRASLPEVTKAVNIEDEEVGKWLDYIEWANLLAELQQETSGGLGGMINKDEKKEKLNEISPSQFQAAARGLMDPLPENRKDTMPDSVVEHVVDSALHDFVDSFSHPGWKTLGLKVVPNITLNRENQPFVGFSPCNFQEITSEKVKAAKSTENLVELILQATRTYCIKECSVMIKNLLAEGFIVANGQNSFQINPDLKILNQDKLTTGLTLKLLQAFELAAFSEVYYKEVTAPSISFTDPDGSKLSRSVFLLGKYAKTIISTYRKSKIRMHCVKIRRGLATTLKSFLFKLIQDKIILQGCDKCREDKTINYNDSVYIMGLMQFIFRGVALYMHGDDFEESFNIFYSRNKLVFEGRVKSYYT